MVYIYAVLTVLTVLLLRIIFTKKDYDDIRKIKSEFDDWQENKNSKAPNTYEFKKLFDKVPDIKDTTVKLPELGYSVTASVISSFPSSHGYLSAKQYIYLDTMIDYFEYQFKSNFNLVFWIKFYLFFPEHVIKWLGIKQTSIRNRISDFIYWIIIAMITFMKPALLSFINHLLR